MEVFLNGREHAMESVECANLAELIADAERGDPTCEDAVVVGVEVDGRVLEGDELAALESCTLDGVSRVSIESRSALSIARSVLSHGSEYCLQVRSALTIAVAHFREDRIVPGNALLAELIDSLTVLTGISSSAANFMSSACADLVDVQTRLLPWLECLLEAQSAEDPIAIADILEYEIEPLVEGWGKLMHSIIESDDEGGAAAESTLSN